MWKDLNRNFTVMCHGPYFDYMGGMYLKNMGYCDSCSLV
jgi:hypothetical protein